MRLSRRVAAAAALAGLGCATPRPGPWHEDAGFRWRDLPPAGTAAPGFTPVGSQAGVDFSNTVSDSAAIRNRHLMHGSGVAIGDVDGDGLADVYLARIEGPNALYRNRGGWRFEDIASDAGAALADRPSTGATFADLDGDGDLDLLVNAMGGRNSLLLNDGSGRFTDASDASGLVPEARGSTTNALADIDGDGDLDLYVTNYKARTMLDSLTPQQRAFDQLVKKRGDRYEVIPELRDNYRVIVRDDIRAVSVVQRADPDWLYLNDGSGRFERVMLGENRRFQDERGRPLDREPDDFGLAARFFDVNGDRAPDLYVANDFEDPDQFWVNDGAGNFRLVDNVALRQTSNSGMAVDVADVDRDGRPDVFEVDMLANDSRRRKTQMPTHTALPKRVGDYESRAQWQRNVLLLNRGDGSFAEVASLAQVDASGWSWSAVFLDVDLDGFEDLLIGTGHAWDLMDADALERLKSTVSGLDWREERELYPSLELPNVAFRNRGDLTFEDATVAWGFGPEPDISHGMALGDLDRDGDLDVVVNRLNAPALVLRNNAPAPRVAVRLVGQPPNTQSIGSLVRVIGGAVEEQSKEVFAGGLYLSGSEPLLAFAAGQADSLTIEVAWRRGGTTVIRGVRPGRLYEIREPEAPPEPPSAAPATGDAPLFEDVSASVPYRHRDAPYNDFFRQPLLPWRLSQLGPGVGLIDFDRDGDDDLVVGAGSGSQPGFFWNDGMRFRRIATVGARDSFDLTGIAGWLDGRAPRVVIGQSSYEASTPAGAITAPAALAYRLTGAARAEPLVGGDTTSAGPVALADYDQDGDLDLFVGGRVAPGVYPVPGNSRLFRNDDNRFSPDTANAALLRGVGLVSGALFSDVDMDGDADLVLATEWGPIRVLGNEAGRFADRTDAWGLARWTGRWNGVASGDFDNDGRLDLVATNWGRNTTYSADTTAPLLVYYGAYGGDGVVHPVLARHDARLNAVAPLVTLARLTAAVPSVRRRTPTFAAYADAAIDAVLADVTRGGRAQAATLDHMVFLNRGDRFEAVPLPMRAQIAPAFGVTVADFDGDGALDLFLAQNFSYTDIGTPRFDAGRGLVLLGDARGGFAPLSPSRSGIRMPEDQRGAAVGDLDRDGRVDLVVGRNASPVAVFRNQGARPGVSVPITADLVGAVLRLETDEGLGPAQEVHAGGGYWSQNGRLILTGPGSARAVIIRKRGTEERRTITAPPGSR